MANPIIGVQVNVADSDPGYAKLLRRLESQAKFVDIGIHSVSGPELVLIASVNEFGTTRAGRGNSTIIPARSFIRSTVDANRAKYNALAAQVWNKIVAGEVSMQRGLAIVGQQIETDIRLKIITLREPPNAPLTIARKGSDNPLVDEGTMAGSVRYAVKGKNESTLEISSGTPYSAK